MVRDVFVWDRRHAAAAARGGPMRRALTLLEGPEVEFAGADGLLVRAPGRSTAHSGDIV